MTMAQASNVPPNERLAAAANEPADGMNAETRDKLKKVGCFDCGWDYGSPGFPDLLIPNWAWNEIAPHGPGVGTEGGAGILCPNCICRRLEKAGLKGVPSAFVSGPLAYEPRDWILQGRPS